MAGTFEPSGDFNGNKAPSRSPLGELIYHFSRNRAAVGGFLIVVVLTIFAISGFIFTHGSDPKDVVVDPGEIHITAQLLPPMSEYTVIETDDAGNESEKTKLAILGTDELGRDVLTRLWSGSFYSLLVGFVVVGISAVIGILVGGIAGFFGKGRARLPFMVMVCGIPLAFLVNTFEFLGSTAPIFAWLIGGFSIAAFVLMVIAAIIDKHWSTLAWFVAGSLLVLIVLGYPMLVLQDGPQAELYSANLEAKSESEKLIALTAKVVDYANDWQELETAKINEKNAFKQTRELQVARGAYERQFLQLEIGRAEYAISKAKAQRAIPIAEASTIERSRREFKGELSMPDGAERPTGEDLKNALKRIDERKEANAKALEAADEALYAAELALFNLLSSAQKSDVGKSLGIQAPKEAPVAPQKEAEEKSTKVDEEPKPEPEKKPEEIKPWKVETLESVNQLRISKSQWRSDQSSYDVQVKNALESISSTDEFFKWCRRVEIQIVSVFLFILTLLLLTNVAQVGSQENPILRKFFIPVMTIDNFVMRVIEILGSIPRLFLLLTVLAFYDKDVFLVMFVLGVTSWMGTARFVRAEILSLREQDFVSAARSLGLGDFRIIAKHLVPNALSPVLVSMTIGVATAIIIESTLSFLNLGAGPDQVTWGKMLSEGRAYITSAWWLTTLPGIAIFIVVLAFNLLGEGLREAMNPKLRQR